MKLMIPQQAHLGTSLAMMQSNPILTLMNILPTKSVIIGLQGNHKCLVLIIHVIRANTTKSSHAICGIHSNLCLLNITEEKVQNLE